MSLDIERLKNDADYYGAFGKQFLSNSDIGNLLKNPRDFKKSLPDSPTFAKGRYFHQLILEPEKIDDWLICDSGSRNTKIYKEFCSENGIELALLSKEVEEIESWANTMMSNMSFFDEIRREGVEYEVPAIKEVMGLMWKGKADIVHPEIVIDLKTTSSIDDFKWNARKYNYDSQAWLYNQFFGKPMVFYVVDKNSKMLGVFESSDSFLESGKMKVEKAVEVYHRFYGDNPTDDIDSFFINECL